MSRPSCSGSASAVRMAPTMAPSYMTTSRSDNASSSSRSSETSRIAAPARARASSSVRTYSEAPTSSPRVGWATTTTRGSCSRTRARSTFWMLPPDSVPNMVVRRSLDGIPLDEVPCMRLDALLVEPARRAEVVDALQHEIEGDRQVQHQARVAVLGDATDARRHHRRWVPRGHTPDRRTSSTPPVGGACPTAPHQGCGLTVARHAGDTPQISPRRPTGDTPAARADPVRAVADQACRSAVLGSCRSDRAAAPASARQRSDARPSSERAPARRWSPAPCR